MKKENKKHLEELNESFWMSYNPSVHMSCIGATKAVVTTTGYDISPIMTTITSSEWVDIEVERITSDENWYYVGYAVWTWS